MSSTWQGGTGQSQQIQQQSPNTQGSSWITATGISTQYTALWNGARPQTISSQYVKLQRLPYALTKTPLLLFDDLKTAILEYTDPRILVSLSIFRKDISFKHMFELERYD